MNKNKLFYISQSMSQASDIKYFLEDENMFRCLEEQNKNIIPIEVNDILSSKNKRYMVVAEPGYGKTRLLKEIVTSYQKEAFFIDAKRVKNNVLYSIEKCKYFDAHENTEEVLQKQRLFKNHEERKYKLDSETIVCIDALDEVPFYELYELFEKIDDFIADYGDVKLILSCRTHHIQKIQYDIKSFDFQYIELDTFSGKKIEKYLEYRLQKTIDLNEIYQKSKMSNLIDFISIPRYLYYFSELLIDGSLDEVTNLSRAEMFDHFIYRKLDKELKEKTPQSQIDLLKRVLEKLALIMKINQVSIISKDELMTVFDQMDSNFSQIAFRDDLLQKLYDRSLIKDNIDSIEFENQEFLDYLSAKELARFEKVEQTFFDVAIEPHLNEVYTSWFYVLPFFFELQPFMVGVFLDYIERKKESSLSSEYFKALLNIEASSLDDKLRSRIFDMVFNYYMEHNKWFNSVSDHITSSLARYYCEEKYAIILKAIEENEHSKNDLYVRRTNAIELVKFLIELGYLDNKEREYWRKKIEVWLKLNQDENRYLQRTIVSGLYIFSEGNIEWIKSLYFIFETGIQLQEQYARSCFRMAPNDKFSIDVYLKTNEYWYENKNQDNLVRGKEEYEYILQLKDSDAMIYAFNEILTNNKDYFLCEALKENEKIKFKENLYQIYNKKLSKFLLKLVDDSFNNNDYFCDKIYQLFVEVLFNFESSYLSHLVSTLYSKYNNDIWHFGFHNTYIMNCIDENNFQEFIKALDIFEENKKEVLLQLRYKANDEIKVKIEELYPSEIAEEKRLSKERQKKLNETESSICSEWSKKIDYQKDEFATDVFRYFNNRKEDLIECPDYQKHYIKLCSFVEGVLKNNNPLDGEVKKSGNCTEISNVSFFKDCIEFAYHEKLELSQTMIDNIFRYFPFTSDYEKTLDISQNPSKEAIQDIVDVYAGKREDDLGIYNIHGFIEFYKRKARKEFEPIFLAMLENEKIDKYDKESLVDILPTSVLTIEKIRVNISKFDKDDYMYEKLLCTLIEKHQDREAINEALEWVKDTAKEQVVEDSHHHVPIAFALSYSKYSIEEDKKLLMFTVELSKKNKKANGSLLTNIVDRHIQYMIDTEPKQGLLAIREIEKFLSAHKNEKDLHWFEYRLVDLKKAYLSKQKAQNIMKSIKKYNELIKNDYLPISSPIELLETIKEVIDKDIRRWIEDEGAYKHINELSMKKENKNSEDFIQKSLKSQIELALLKKGFRETDFIFKREEQTMDDKRLDFTISYGFIGSVVLELKLSHNSEAIATRKDGKEYVSKLESYIKGSGSSFGLFVIFNIEDDVEKFDKKIVVLKELYENEEKVTVLGLDCVNE